MLRHLLPKGRSIVKMDTVHRHGQSPGDIVISATAPATKASVLGSLQVSTVSWNRESRDSKATWQSPAFAWQRFYSPGAPVLPAVTAFKVRTTGKGALVGLLDPASIGSDTLWNAGLLLWVAPHKTPKILWRAKGRQAVADGALMQQGDGLVVRQDGCRAIEAVLKNGHGVLQPLSCTDLTARIAGQRLTFPASQNGQHIHPTQSRLTLSKGTTLVFWPANAATAKRVNDGRLDLFGGHAVLPSQVPLDPADTLVEWSFTFTPPGTYRLAIVGDTTPAVTVPSTVTVTVTG